MSRVLAPCEHATPRLSSFARLRPAAITRHQRLTAEGTCHYEFTQQVFRT